MAFAEDLLAQSFLLLNKETKNPKQASLRRAVSTAYYAVFHLFIQEGCANWNATAVRENLARAFSHQTMYKACTAAENAPYPLPVQPAVASKLRALPVRSASFKSNAIWPTTATPQSGTESRPQQKSIRQRPPSVIGSQFAKSTSRNDS